jgi:phosphoglucomutase
LCKIYAESLCSEEHLAAIKEQAAAIMQDVFTAADA